TSYIAPLPARLAPGGRDAEYRRSANGHVAFYADGKGGDLSSAEPKTWSNVNSDDKFSVKFEDFANAVGQADRDGDGKTTRAEWLAAGGHDWTRIWIWPAVGALLTCILFWFGFRDEARPAAS